MQRHQVTHKSYRSYHQNKEVGFKCEVCEKSFTRLDTCTKHKREVHGGIRYPCTQCPANYAQQHKLKKHMEKHTRNTCNICGEIISLKNQSRHLREVHSAGPSLQCPQCPKSFKRRDQLNSHISNIHDRDEPVQYVCYFCERKFSKKVNLNQHVVDLHTKEKKFSCPGCPEEFSRLCNMERHLSRGKHTKGYVCSKCDKSFTTLATLHRHKDDVHNQVQNFCCSECPEKFSRLENLKRHNKRGKHSFVFNCEYCNETLTAKSDNDMNQHFIYLPPGKDHKRIQKCVTFREREREAKNKEILADKKKFEALKKTKSWQNLSYKLKIKMTELAERHWKDGMLYRGRHWENYFENMVGMNKVIEVLDFRETEEWEQMPTDMKIELDQIWSHCGYPSWKDVNKCAVCVGIDGSDCDCDCNCNNTDNPWWKEHLEDIRKRLRIRKERPKLPKYRVPWWKGFAGKRTRILDIDYLLSQM